MMKKNGFTKKEWREYPEICQILSGLFRGKETRKNIFAALDMMMSDFNTYEYDESNVTMSADTLDEMLKPYKFTMSGS